MNAKRLNLVWLALGLVFFHIMGGMWGRRKTFYVVEDSYWQFLGSYTSCHYSAKIEKCSVGPCPYVIK